MTYVTHLLPDGDQIGSRSVRPLRGHCPGMDDHRPRLQPLRDPVFPTRAELVRYFAWGYLSRRELNERLRHLSSLRKARQARTAA